MEGPAPELTLSSGPARRAADDSYQLGMIEEAEGGVDEAELLQRWRRRRATPSQRWVEDRRVGRADGENPPCRSREGSAV